MFSDEEDALIDFMESQFGCHTLILYGSRGLGTHRPTSDWDILAINQGTMEAYCHQTVEGVGEVNAYIYPELMVEFHRSNPSKIYKPREIFVRRIRTARVLIEHEGMGTYIIEKAKELYAAGPQKMPPSYAEHVRYSYFQRCLRAQYLDTALPDATPEIMRDYWRIEAQFGALSNYFKLRSMWEPAPKDALAYLDKHDFQAFDAFERGLAPDASPQDLQTLFNIVLK